ncbi:hypothetical protein [Tateyamaria sp. SN6-1]|uniref:hypothetical protein n=1 Tax=Tateyamaria sp. SN6-1 TaxID=3092148 RepID=UPI0039F621F5
MTTIETHSERRFVIVSQNPEICADIETLLGLLDSTERRFERPVRFTPDPGEFSEIALMVYQSATDAIATTLARGVPPDAALTQWQEQATAHLTCLRRYRRAVFSTSLAQLTEAPDDLRSALTARYGCLFRNDAPRAIGIEQSHSQLHRFLAAHMLRGAAQARRLDAELAALSWHSTPYTGSGAPDLGAVLASLSATENNSTVERHALEVELNRLRAEIRTQITEQQALEIAIKDRDDQARRTSASLAAKDDMVEKTQVRIKAVEDRAAIAQKQITNLESRLHMATKMADATKTITTALRDENASLTGQMCQVEDALRHALIDAESAQRRNETLRNELRDRDADVAALLASRSWRITAPLRALRRRFSRG